MATLSELNLYPIKSCAAVSAAQAVMTPAGLSVGAVRDREWMVVDSQGRFLTQREHPKMALIAPLIGDGFLHVGMPGMPDLDLPLVRPQIQTQTSPDNAGTRDVAIWNDRLKAQDCGQTAAQWFSDALGISCRLVRFAPDAHRIANARWTGGIEAPTLFSDGYPVLIISQASLEDLNSRLLRHGRSALPMNRFRPNVVIGGVDAFEEDYAETISIGGIVLKPVKPCPRCPIPAIDQATGESGPDPLDILASYRADPRVGGAITFGMNAIVIQGQGLQLKIGQAAEVELAFQEEEKA